MAETLVQYQLGADSSAVERAFRDVEASAARFGRTLEDALTKAGQRGGQALGQDVTRGAQQAEGAIKNVGTAANATAGFIKGLFGAAIVGQFLRELTRVKDSLVEIGNVSKLTGLDAGRIGAVATVAGQDGVSQKDVTSGIKDLGAKANKEFREGEGELTKLLEANNLKITDRQGRLKSVNELLLNAATLVQNAKTEFDKIEIVRILGLSEDWIKTLEKGPSALQASVKAAEDAGGAIDREMVAKAQAFDKAWSEATVAFSTNLKASIVSIGALLSGIISQARQLEGDIATAESRAGRARNFNSAAIEARNQFKLDNEDTPGEIARQQVFLRAQRFGNYSGGSEARIGAGLSAIARADKPTVVTSGSSKGGGGGGSESASDEEAAQARLERYIKSLSRQGEVIKSQIDTFGQSNAVRKAAEEIARAAVDLNEVDEKTRAKLIERIKEEVAANETKRETLERLNKAQQDARESAQAFGQIGVSALSDLIVNGAKFSDVMRNVAKSIANAAIQAAILGQGPLAGLFGLSGTNGNPGGLAGLFFGGASSGNTGGLGSLLSSSFSSGFGAFASGGYLPAGMSIVGENGPEVLFNPSGSNKRIYPSGVSPFGSQSGGGSGGLALTINAPNSTPDSVMALKRDLPGIILKTISESQRRGGS